MVKKGGEDDDEFDEEDEKLVKEENKSEYELQLSIAELIGILFKTHQALCGALIEELFKTVLQQSITSSIKQKKKFALFILDDMVEFLGSSLGMRFNDVARAFFEFAAN